ncbi:MAG: PilZ domain-containing protein [Candidatus Acidiferrales bacterium]
MKPQTNAKLATSPAKVIATRPPTAEERRRAQRVLLRIRVMVQVDGKPDPLEGSTHTVSASGAMLILPQGLSEGTKVIIENPKTQSKVEARVVRPPQMSHEGSQVPIEFTSPSPNFWGVFFPPIVN